MKLTYMEGQGIGPIKRIYIPKMENVVIIAGANGSGKTALKQAIIDVFKIDADHKLGVTIEATRPEEETQWGLNPLSIPPNETFTSFRDYMNSARFDSAITGTLINIDADRSLKPLEVQSLNLSIPDPDDEPSVPSYYLSTLPDRWNETVKRIHLKVAYHDRRIAEYVRGLPEVTGAEVLKRIPDPFLPFQEVFARLLPGKSLRPVDPKSPKDFQYNLSTGECLPFSTLSSGEKEVIKIVFDVLLKEVRHCIFLIDEPELHLHPTLMFRLIETLKTMGDGTNQFIFFTHSPDLISTYYATGNVYFIDSQPTGQNQNQAHRLSEFTENHSELVKTMGDNLGLFAVGKKLVFVEGRQSSRDRLTYQAIAENYFPEARIIPAESAENVIGLSKFAEELRNSIFGINFFMIRDRDGLLNEDVTKLEQNGRLRCLPKRHLENYFLDADILAKVAARFCISDGRLLNAAVVDALLREIAQNSIGEALSLNIKEYLRVNQSFKIPSVKDIAGKTVDAVEAEFVGLTLSSFSEHAARFEKSKLEAEFAQQKRSLETALSQGDWKKVFPGKLLFETYCGQRYLNTDRVRVREAYTQIALAEKPEVFQDIINILRDFSTSTSAA